MRLRLNTNGINNAVVDFINVKGLTLDTTSDPHDPQYIITGDLSYVENKAKLKPTFVEDSLYVVPANKVDGFVMWSS